MAAPVSVVRGLGCGAFDRFANRSAQGIASSAAVLRASLTGTIARPSVAPLKLRFFAKVCVRAVALFALVASVARAQPVLAGFSTSVTLDDEGAWVYLFVDGSAGPRSVLISAAGPGYAAQSAAAVVADPQIEVLDPSGNRIAYNDDRASSLLTDASLPSYARHAKDAGLRLSLVTGAYVVRITGVQGATGIVALDVIDSSTRPGLASWALRARGGSATETPVRLRYAGTGHMNMATFVSGPNLPVSNPLEDPRLTISTFEMTGTIDAVTGAQTFTATDKPYIVTWDNAPIPFTTPARFRSPLMGDAKNAGFFAFWTFPPTLPSPMALIVKNQTTQTNGMFLLEVHNLDNTWARPPVVYAPMRSITLPSGGSATMNPLVGGDSSTRVTLEKDGATFADLSNGPLLILGAGAGHDGTYRVRATNASGNALSTAWTVTVAASAPRFVTQPQSTTATAGEPLTLSATVSGTGLRYQWLKNGLSIPGATNATLTIASTTEADAGSYQLLVGNATDSVTSSPAVVTIVSNDPGRLTNLAVRAFSGTGDRVLIVGFTLNGPGAKPVLIRGIGPGLAAFGLSGMVADPRLAVFGGTTEIASNDNWSGNDGRTLGAFALATGSHDAVVAQTLAAQNYTAQVSGSGNTVGEALVELYDGNAASSSLRLVNLSTRTQLDAGQRLIVGLTISGRQPVRILVRAVGPTLTSFGLNGAHPDPTLELYSGPTVIQQNDNWQGDDGRTAGAFPLIASSKDAALSALLAPGSYSVHALGAGGTSGVVLVEVYELR
jgi:hypothetical protein